MSKEHIRETISQSYGLAVTEMEQTSGGWSAEAYVAKTNGADYFVKVYDKRRPSVQPWIARMAIYMPVVLWLYKSTSLGDSMIAPLFTTNGDYKAECDRYVFLVFPMLHGVTLGDRPLRGEQVRQLAAILAELHSYGNQIPIGTDAMQEDYSLPFLQEFSALMEARERSAVLQNALLPYKDSVRRAVEALQDLSASLGAVAPPNVLCHTDIHGGNLMWTDRLVLIDWEGLRLAPAEADLFTFTDGFFLNYASAAFMSAYQKIRKDYVVNQDAMLFYRLRRRIEDIGEFAHSIHHDSLTTEEATAYLHQMQRECAALSNMLHK